MHYLNGKRSGNQLHLIQHGQVEGITGTNNNLLQGPPSCITWCNLLFLDLWLSPPPPPLHIHALVRTLLGTVTDNNYRGPPSPSITWSGLHSSYRLWVSHCTQPCCLPVAVCVLCSVDVCLLADNITFPFPHVPLGCTLCRFGNITCINSKVRDGSSVKPNKSTSWTAGGFYVCWLIPLYHATGQ